MHLIRDLIGEIIEGVTERKIEVYEEMNI